MKENCERKALIKVGYACNNLCVFCHAATLRGHVDATTESLVAKVGAARVQGYEMAVFSGGEATIRSDLGTLVKAVAREKLSLGLVTNGRRFAYRPFLEGLLRYRLRYVYMSLHGARAETHDRTVGAKAFEETLAAIRNVASIPDLHFTVNTVLTRWNADELENIVALLSGIGGMRIKVSYLEPKGAALKDLGDLLLPPTEAAERIQAAISHGQAHAEAATEFAWDALPFCLMPGLDHLYDDLLTNRIEVMSEADETAFFPVDHLNKGKASPCDNCAWNDTCPGLYHAALERYGHEYLKPFSTPK